MVQASNSLNTEPFDYRISKSWLFKCFRNSNVRYSDPTVLENSVLT